MLLLLSLFLSSFVYSAPEPSVNNTEVEHIQEAVDKIPLDNSGDIDSEKLNSSVFFFSTKAQERINEINVWLTENVSWLSFIFGIPPEISWLFFWILLTMLFALTHLVFNGVHNMVFIDDERFRLPLGSAIFIVLLALRVYYCVGSIITNIMDIFWNAILPWGIFIAIILIIVFGILLILLLLFLPKVGVALIRAIFLLFGKKTATNKGDARLARKEKKLDKDLEKGEEVEALVDGLNSSR